MTDVSGWVPQTVYTIYIAAPAERVWQALTSAEFSRDYFSGFAIEIEPRVGGALRLLAPDGTPHITGEVITWDPPHKLSITWNVGWPSLVEALGGTVVSYTIEQAGEAVKLTMTEAHERPLDDDILSGGRQGWPAILSSLKSLLETGRAPRIAVQPPVKMIAALRRAGVTVPGGPE
ncbi:transcriptional regulator, ArsR family [Rhodopseudomonas palustris]|uniref:SRPBCC family protein n=1 Tax=Rhodopseudomonas palustris TaxID=1076 RepID=UPI000D19B030|nr:SRPBCC family protein [Rhodopseudomonas palustris]AVT75411.1 transcriptional regulator, ArsR family [Rhodopseudomonas palustris]